MKSQFKFETGDTPTALVIVFPPGVNGLFNSGVHGLVREVQAQLDGVYVTYALSSGSSPDLRAAMSAARFVGCESAVVIPAGSATVGENAVSAGAGDWLLAASHIGSEVEAPAVVEAYLTAVAEAGKAA